VLSDDVCCRAGLAPDALSSREVAIRGRDLPIRVRTAPAARLLATAAEATSL